MSSTLPRDPYDVLGVPRDADETTIKKSFRRLARELHPDVNAHDPQAEEKFKEAAEAYEILNDPKRREVYDRFGHEGLRSGGMRPNFEGFGSLGDLFEAFFGGAGGFGGAGFGGQPGGPVQGDDAIIGLDIDLAQAAAGTPEEVTFEAIHTCERCEGEGGEPGTPVETCGKCDGTGVVQTAVRSPFGQVLRQSACDRCGGEGRIPQTPCTECDGRGRVVKPRTLSVDVPPGIADGQRIRIQGRGHAGERGGPPGDLYIQVRIAPDEHLLRDGDDLVTVLDVAAPLAALGATLPVPVLGDAVLDVRVPTGTQPGEVITVAHEGMPLLRRPERRGDLRVVVNVVIPRRLTDEQREHLRQLADSLTPENLAAPETMSGKLRRLFGGRR